MKRNRREVWENEGRMRGKNWRMGRIGRIGELREIIERREIEGEEN